MTLRRLTANERKVLTLVQHDSQQSVAVIARKGRMRHHSVVYALKRLKENGIIRPYLLTNPHTLGLTDYCIFFNCVGEEQQARRKIINHCLESPQVAYFAELTGTYQFSVSLFCRTIFEVTDFFAALGRILPRSSFEMSFAVRVRWAQFLGRWSDSGANPILLDRTEEEAETSIDEIDRKILGVYSSNAGAPLTRIAAIVGTSESTIRYRLAALQKRRVIHSMPYFVDNTKVGVTTFRVIIAAKGLNQTVHAKLYDYISRHPRASAFVNCIGGWDFELSFDVDDPAETGTILEDLHDRFGTHIRHAHTVTELAIHRAHHFPIAAGTRAGKA